MTILEKLTYHETDQLTDWLNSKEKSKTEFIDEFKRFADDNQSVIKDYCRATEPTDFSSLSMVYTALSNASKDWNVFLLEEIKRVTSLAKNKQINPAFLEVLQDIEMENIFIDDYPVYVEVLNFLTANLQEHNDKDFNLHLLELMDWYLIEYEDDENGDKDFKKWMKPILVLANGSDFKLKLKARKVLYLDDYTNELTPLTFIEKMRKILS